MSVPGPTLLDLTQISGTDAYGISFIFTARSTGYLIGSLTGGVIMDCMKNEDLPLMFSSLLMAIGAFTIPWCRNLPMLLTTFLITGYALGFSNTGCNGGLLRIWGKKGAAIMQGLHFTYGIGGFIGPILAAPFLSVQPPTVPTDLTLMGVAQNLTADVLAAAANYTEEQVVTFNEDSVPSVTYTYAIVGSLAAFASACFVVVYCLASDEKHAVEEAEKETIRDPGLPFTILVVVLGCIQTGLISGVEVSFTQMLTSYVVHSKHGLSKVMGSYMTSVYWATFTLMRGLSVLLAMKFSVRKILGFDLLVSVTAALVLLTIGTWSVTGLWVGTAMIGIGVAAVFPATLSWMEKYININNRITSIFTLVASLLEMIVPLSIGMYLSTQPNVLFHFMISATTSSMTLFIILNVILNRKGKKYEKPPAVVKSSEKVQLSDV